MAECGNWDDALTMLVVFGGSLVVFTLCAVFIIWAVSKL